MTRNQIKETLMVFRPGTADESDPEFTEALKQARADAELSGWLQAHCDSYQAMKGKLRSLQPPPDLKERILAGRKITPFPARVRPVVVWAAVAAAMLIAAGLLLVREPPPSRTAFESFRLRMVGTALRQYGMEVVTNRSDVIRQFMKDNGRPADYVLPEKLQALTLSGGGALRWRNHPVTMLCFDRGDSRMLFLFVIDRSAVETDPIHPPPPPEKVSDLQTVSWNRDRLTYLLTGPDEPGFAAKYR